MWNNAVRVACAGILFLAAIESAGASDASCKNHYILTIDDPCLSSPGTLDPRFGDGGFARLDSGVYPAAILPQSDGKVLLFGSKVASATSGTPAEFAFMRVTREGALDTTFGEAGFVRGTTPGGVDIGGALHANGLILSGGQRWFERDPDDYYKSRSDAVLVRFLADGQVDRSFGDDGLVVMKIGWTSSMRPALVQPDGKIIAKGVSCEGEKYNCRPFLARYAVDGALDATFGADGVVHYKHYSVGTPALTADGKLVDSFYDNVGPIRSMTCGGSMLCTCTGFSGETWSCRPPTVQEQALYRASGLMRLNADGTLDPSFGEGGMVATPFEAAFILPLRDGRMVTAGSSLIADSSHPWLTLGRFNSDGSIDTSFGNRGIAAERLPGGIDGGTWDRDWPSGLKRQPDGKLVVVASRGDGFDWSNILLVRYTADGQLDTGFGSGGFVHTVRTSLDFAGDYVLQADGTILVIGDIWAQGTGLLRYRGDEVVEFRHDALGHYLMTVDRGEQQAIAMPGSGWTLTGESFASNASIPMCRFSPASGSGAGSHFFTIDPIECEQVKRDAGWRFEGFDFYASAATAGACAEGSIPVYRAYNRGFGHNDSNHRYTTSAAIYDEMIAAGWSPEGVVFCAAR